MSKIYMKKYKKLSLFLIMILSLVNILISCNKKSEVIETTTETTETVKEYITSNDMFIIDENSDKPKPNGMPTSIPPGFKNPGEINNPPTNNMMTKPESYTAVNTYEENESVNKLRVESTGKDESAVLVTNGATMISNNINIKRTSENSTGGDLASFYGVGAAALTIDGNLFLSNGDITTDAAGGAGVFAYDKGVANLENITIHTNKDTSGTIHVAGGGAISAKNLTALTEGNSSAAIRSDRGGGKINVTGGTYETNGVGSPAIYCTADITANNAKLIANNSEGICIEGLNQTTLNNVTLTSNMHDDTQNDTTWSVIVYQSMSGDSEIGKGVFNMNGGSIDSKNGGIFYTTNTESEFNLNSVVIKSSEDSEFLLQVTGNNNKRGWGKTGENGAKCVFNANNQLLNGNIIVDSISTLNLNLTGATLYTGDLIYNNQYAGTDNGKGYVDVSISDDSVWIISQDTVLNNIVYKGKIVDDAEQIVPIYDTKGNLLIDGISGLKVTVNSLEE